LSPCSANNQDVTRWLLNTFPVWLLGVVLVGGFVALGILFLHLMQRRYPNLVSSEQGDVGANAVVIVIGMYGVLLAFIILTLFESFAAAEENTENEANALAQVRRASLTFPNSVVREVDERMRDYVQVVMHTEWPLMSEGKESHEAWAAINHLYDPFREYQPETQSQKVFYNQAVTDLGEVVAARRTRLVDAQQVLPTEFLVLVFGGGILVVAFLCLGGSSNRTVHGLFVGGVAALLGFNILLVVILDHPFSGDLGIKPEVFIEGTLADLR
jgi:hypothetical protein